MCCVGCVVAPQHKTHIKRLIAARGEYPRVNRMMRLYKNLTSNYTESCANHKCDNPTLDKPIHGIGHVYDETQ